MRDGSVSNDDAERSAPEKANSTSCSDPLLLEFLDDARSIEERPVFRGARVTLHVLALLIGIAVIWAALAEVDRIVVARGKLVTTASSIVIQPLEASIIREILVRPGEMVAAGQELARLDATSAASELAELDSRLDSLSAQIRRLRAELGEEATLPAILNTPSEEIQIRYFTARRLALEGRRKLFEETLARLEAAINRNRRDQQAISAQLKTASELKDMQVQLLESSSGSRQKMLERHAQWQALERELRDAQNRQPELEKEKSEAQAQRDYFFQDWRQQAAKELTDAERERLELTARRDKVSRRAELAVLTSPSRGIVLEVIDRSVGSVVREAEPIVTVVPIDVASEAEVEVDARDVGFVRTNDHAQVKIDAFPYQRHGLIPARVRTISEDAFPRTKQNIALDRGSEAFYKTRLNLDSVALRDVPNDVRLIPGMTLTAEILVGHRTVLSYFLHPILRSLDESLREP